jgi:hypothetical protein
VSYKNQRTKEIVCLSIEKVAFVVRDHLTVNYCAFFNTSN